MMVLVTLTVGLVIWLTAWAFEIKAFDAFLFTSIITVLAAGARIALPYFQRFIGGAPVPPGER
jgi:hypothetical protein